MTKLIKSLIAVPLALLFLFLLAAARCLERVLAGGRQMTDSAPNQEELLEMFIRLRDKGDSMFKEFDEKYAVLEKKYSSLLASNEKLVKERDELREGLEAIAAVNCCEQCKWIAQETLRPESNNG